MYHAQGGAHGLSHAFSPSLLGLLSPTSFFHLHDAITPLAPSSLLGMTG